MRWLVFATLLLSGCPDGDDSPDMSVSFMIRDGSLGGAFCELPGSVVYTPTGDWVVGGGKKDAPDITWLRVPDGFCVHYFGHVPTARQLRFAPGGELFVASPTMPTTGGARDGHATIEVLADDDHDGYAESPIVFLPQLPATQGLLFTSGYLYYQDDTKIRRLPYTPGMRTASAPGEIVAEILLYRSIQHWPKTLDIADDGTIFVGNGGDQGEDCDPGRPFHGGILKLGATGATPVTKGLRNPIALRCQHGHNVCYATELALDYSAAAGGREKLIPIHDGDDWGYPCCATKSTPYASVTPTPNCDAIVAENNAFLIGDTPFGLDFAPAAWPSPFASNVIVALHGAFGSWTGARVVAIATDPASGAPLTSTTVPSGANSGAVIDFATGWDNSKLAHGRPGSVEVARDGRVFIGNDVTGDIVWIAPIGTGADGGVQ
jgi:glucose/arabinose dehydrogenase